MSVKKELDRRAKLLRDTTTAQLRLEVERDRRICWLKDRIATAGLVYRPDWVERWATLDWAEPLEPGFFDKADRHNEHSERFRSTGDIQ